MASVETNETQAFVESLLKSSFHLAPSDTLWLGAKWYDHEVHEGHEGGGFHWTLSENAITYNNWATPLGLEKHSGQCVSMSSDGKWHSVNCTTKIHLLCEKDLEKPMRKDKDVLWALMYGLLAIVFIALLVGCCIYCLVRTGKKSQRSNSSKFSGIYYKRGASNKNGEFQ